MSTLAAADFAARLAFGSLKIFDAATAIFLLVVALAVAIWVSAEAATDFSAFDADLLVNTLDADDATRLLDSDFAMCCQNSFAYVGRADAGD
jgi:hypothetical protein